MRFVFLLASLVIARAQTPAFEVVSIKIAPPDAESVSSGGGPGTRKSGFWTCQNMTLHNIVWIAYNSRHEQLVAPDWMRDVRFNITAKVPEGATTRDQLYPMLQYMLAERFALKVHREQREVQGYELAVAKNGPKFKESGPEPPPPPDPGPPSLDAKGYPILRSGVSGPNRAGNRARGWV
jgi:uncharacterized protein (TIGR03435 family)